MSFYIEGFVFKLPGIESPRTLQDVLASEHLKGQFDNYDATKSLRKSRHLSVATKLFSSAAIKLLEQEKLAKQLAEQPERVGVFITGENVNLKDDFDFDLCAKTHGPDHVSPLQAPNTLANVVGSHFARISSIQGPNCTISAGQHGVYHAMDMADLSLENKAIDTAIIGAVEVTSEYHRLLQPSLREVAVAAVIAQAGPSAAIVFYPPLMCTMPAICEQEMAQQIARQADKYRNRPQVDMVWLASGYDELEPDKFCTVLAAKNISQSVVLGERLFGKGGPCNPMILACLAHEMLSDPTANWSLLAPAILGGQPKQIRSIAIVSYDQLSQASTLIMAQR